MPLIVYNISIALALILIAVGSCATWGWPVGCLVTGGVIIVLTFASLLLAKPGKEE